uniref:Uncharacterized protein n=1 Tax=Brassica oleracea TaxID=3712 RepID=A0A3P6E3Z7_BRAOL|nr:unnamed protein product [Brassica oleracea]
MIQASIKLYELSLTDVSRNNQSFRFACSSMNLILMELFWFCSYNQLRLIYKHRLTWPTLPKFNLLNTFLL